MEFHFNLSPRKRVINLTAYKRYLKDVSLPEGISILPLDSPERRYISASFDCWCGYDLEDNCWMQCSYLVSSNCKVFYHRSCVGLPYPYFESMGPYCCVHCRDHFKIKVGCWLVLSFYFSIHS